MQITVTIPDEVAAQAHARGLTPESYVERLLSEQRLPSSRPHKTRGQRIAEMERFIEEFSRNSEKIPLLPDEAFTRDSFYNDQDR